MLLQPTGSDSSKPPFSDAQLKPFANDSEDFLGDADRGTELERSRTSTNAPAYPRSFAANHAGSGHVTVPFPARGGRTRFGPAIPPSGVFPAKHSEHFRLQPLSVHHADHDHQLTRELVAEEVSNSGFFCSSFALKFFFHEYGRRVGMVPRSSLKGGKNSLMVEKRTRKPNTTQNQQTPQPRAHRPCLHHHVVFPLCKVKHVRRERV